jgi:lyso-ornithine lipid O-acyltransferase
MTWGLDVPPPKVGVTWAGRLLAVLRGVALLLALLAGVLMLLPVRLGERVAFGLRRPVSPVIVQIVCQIALAVLGLRLQVTGAPMRGQGAIVANHASWLDILVLNAAARVFFVSKAEVAAWPAIGALARLVGTVFIRRDKSDAHLQRLIFEARLRAGHRLLFFPEGTSSDGTRVLPFKSTLFAAFFTPELRPLLHIQPASVTYLAPQGQDARLYGWWGSMDFGTHFLRILCQTRTGQVRVLFHPALPLSGTTDRKALALACETAVREGHGAS